MTVSCICFTEKGARTALRIKQALSDKSTKINIWSGRREPDSGSGDHRHTGEGSPAEDAGFAKETSGPEEAKEILPVRTDLSLWVQEHFHTDDALVFVGAAGIAVRLIAPCVRSKRQDPAVVVVDEAGKWSIALLSGHIGGANDLARGIASGIGAEPIITTATDLRKKFAVDVFAKKNGMVIGDMDLAKEVSAAVLSGKPVGFFADALFPIDGSAPEELTLCPSGARPYEKGTCEDRPLPGISVSLSSRKVWFERNLSLIPRAVVLGVGCRRGIEPSEFERFLFNFLDAADVRFEAVAKVTSIDVKAQEPAICLFCRKYDLPYETYTASQLIRVPGKFSASSFVEKAVGVDNVCERSAVLGAMDRELPGKLIVEKKAYGGMTAALALILREYRWQV